jgi:hypothetical protein
MKGLKEQRILVILLGVAIVVIVALQIVNEGFESINRSNKEGQTKTNLSR